MLLNAECIFITKQVNERNGKQYASCTLENNDSVVQVNVADRLISILESLVKYTKYMCVFEYDKVNTQNGAFTVFRLHDIQKCEKS